MLPTFSFSSTSEEVATALADQITGKNVLVTGTSLGGLGFETARAIAKHANLVIITGYSAERYAASRYLSIKKEIPSANIRRLELDLSSMAAVRAAAAQVNAYPEPLHVLINNAAATIGPFKLTVDGLESQMATNCVGHFLLTTLLAPKLLASKTASFTPRVVFVSSALHASCDGVDLDAIERPNAETYDNWQGYFRTKAAHILTARELSRRARGALQAYSLHPGGGHRVIDPEGLDADGKPLEDPNAPLKFKTIPQGAATTIVAAFDPRIADKSGAYLVDCVENNAAVAPHASDPAMADKLWTLIEKLIGQPFAFP
ncbi:short-chain dehydrogenase [Mycena sanguinolenta]|nr:short-chain dehydrogenase [Mycena sanguinolenta]